jgi:hypothetical protein
MTPDDYFAALAPAQRSALESLRATIRTVTSDLAERRIDSFAVSSSFSAK